MTDETLTTQPTIPAGRFVLRPVRRSDKDALKRHASDERVARMMRNIPHPLPRGAIADFIARAQHADRQEDVWIIDGSGHGADAFLGLVSLERMDRAQCEIGFWVVPGHWGSGIASEAVEALITANPANCRTIFAVVFQDNPASAKILTNLGFIYVGDAEYHSAARGALVPTWTYIKSVPPVAQA